MDQLRSFGRLSWRLQAAWVFLAVTLVALFAATSKFRAKDTVDSLGQRITELHAQHEIILREVRDLANLRVGDLRIPPPRPEINLGGVVVILDMTGAKSPDDPKAAEAAELFAVVTGPNSLVRLVLDGKVRIVRLRLITPHPAEAKGGALPKYAVELELHNLTGTGLDINIPRGQVFENTVSVSGFQNLATADEANVRLGPRELKNIRLLAYCINKGRQQPANQMGYLTPLKIKFEFADQNQLWSEIGKRVPQANAK